MNRLLSLNSYHYRRGGADIVYLEHAAMFEKLGWASAYFAMHHPKNIETPWSRYFVEEIELNGDYPLPDRMRRGLKAVYNLEARRRLRELVREFRPTVAHVHNVYHHLSPSVLPELKAAGVPVVMTAHDLKIACPSYRMLSGDRICEKCRDGNLLHAVAQRCVHGSLAASTLVSVEAMLHTQILHSYRRHVDRIVVPSRFFLRKFVEWGWDESRFTFIPNYVNTEPLQPGFDPGDYVLYLGRLSGEKGLGTLLQASARTGVPVRIAGTGPLAAQLQQQATQLGAPVRFVGFQSGQALHDLVRGARATVLPSEWYENAPLGVLESLALGKPVIGADIGGIPEMVEPERSGWLFPSADVDALAARLTEVASMPDDRLRELGRSSRALVEQRFSKDEYQRAFQALYAGLR